jgi:hypothetical protein
MSLLKSPVFQFLLVLLVIASLTAALPREQVLGTNIRIVYLHAAWILAGEVTLGFAALCGLVGLISRRINWNRWSAALGLSGLFFWVTSLPLSLWSMQANWNGLFLAEPRFRLAAIFAVAGVLLQAGLMVIAKPVFTSIGNILFFAALRLGLSQAGYVMHPPPSPIFGSGNILLQGLFIVILLLVMAASFILARGWLKR